jgi:hypothetical protein
MAVKRIHARRAFLINGPSQDEFWMSVDPNVAKVKHRGKFKGFQLNAIFYGIQDRVNMLSGQSHEKNLRSSGRYEKCS